MRIRKIVVWTAVAALSCSAPSSWGFQDPPPAGLKGIIPAFAPDNLSEGYFQELATSIDDSWKDWTRETATAVKDFYEGANATVQDQRNALQKLRTKLGIMEKALGDPRYHSISPKLSQLYGRLAPQVDMAEAVLNSLTAEPGAGRRERLEPSLARLKSAADGVRSDMRGFQGGANWLKWARVDELAAATADQPELTELIGAVKHKLAQRETYSADVKSFVSRPSMLDLEDALTQVQLALVPTPPANPEAQRAALVKMLEAVDDYRANPSAEKERAIRQMVQELQAQGGGHLPDVLAAQFQNYNLRLFVSEGMANKFFMERRRESSSINDRVMEAWVRGNQTTDVVSRLDLLPSEQHALFAVRLNGNVNTNANAYAAQATIHTVGHHRFTAAKAVVFDGHVFHTRPARVEVLANNHTVGASTKFSGIPILGRIANNIAMSEANKRTGQANAIARGKIAEQVGVELDKEAATQFGNASRDLEANTYGPLRKYDLYPDEMALSTTEQVLTLTSRLMAADEVGGSRPGPVGPVPAAGLIAQIHESLLTNGIDSIGLQGRMTEPQVKELFESRLSEILGKAVKFPENPNAPPSDTENVFVFDPVDPVRFTIDNGIVTLHIKAALERSNGENIPPQIISVPLAVSLQGDKIHIARGDNVRVQPVERVTDARTQIVRAQVMRQKIQSALPEQDVDAVFEVDNQGKKVQLRITGLSANAGWLTVTME